MTITRTGGPAATTGKTSVRGLSAHLIVIVPDDVVGVIKQIRGRADANRVRELILEKLT